MFEKGAGNPRATGTLLLTMLIKKEEFHLQRSLPLWAPIIDFWVIGIGATDALLRYVKVS